MTALSPTGSSTYSDLLDFAAAQDLEWNALDGKNILIAGAGGGIGSFLIDVLARRNAAHRNRIRIIAAGRNENRLKERFERYRDVSIVTMDIAAEAVPPLRCDYIIHAASNTHPIQYASKPIDTIVANTLGTRNLLELAARHLECRMLFLSSVEIYGENRGDVEAFSEEYCGYIDCNTLRAGYPEGKRAGEALCQAYVAEKNVDAVIARLSRVYGPTMAVDDSKAIAQMIRNAVTREDIVLKSDGAQLYSYAFVADAVSALLCVLLRGETGAAYNAASDDSDVTLRGLAEMLAGLAGVRVVFTRPEANEAKGFSTATKALLDTAKLKKLGWESRHGLSDGLKRTLAIREECR